MATENWQEKEVANALALLHGLHRPNNRNKNFPRNPDNLKPICRNCIGMCCISMAFIGLSVIEQTLLLTGGTVWDDWVFLEGDEIDPRVVKLIVTYHNTGKIPPELELYRANKSKTFLFDLGRKKQCNPIILGPCGYLQSNGHCGIYHYARPEPCGKFPQSGKDCQRIFVAKGSPAALEIEKIINSSSLYLSVLAYLITGFKRQTNHFQFSSQYM
ncbi:MAG: hypothetical protein QHH09_03735 [Microgenomates group bacterium]|nr:hypothetical protein [Microgenomates group bacterium]